MHLVALDYGSLSRPVNTRFLVIRLLVVSLDFCVSCLAATGGLIVLRSAALGVLLFIQLGLKLLFSVENLPLVVCLILASYYLWGVYDSFIKKYEDLAIYLSNCQDQLTNHDITSNQSRICLPWREEERLKTRIIPKELFNIACEELMPIRGKHSQTSFKSHVAFDIRFRCLYVCSAVGCYTINKRFSVVSRGISSKDNNFLL